MNWEALIIIGLFTLSLGVLIFVPAWFWAKRKLHDHPAARTKIKMTKAGLFLIPLFIVILICGLLMDFLAPESILGQFVKTPGGRFLYLMIVVSIFWGLEAILRSKGIKLIEHRDSQ